jgi:hypothetical protein
MTPAKDAHKEHEAPILPHRSSAFVRLSGDDWPIDYRQQPEHSGGGYLSFAVAVGLLIGLIYYIINY